MSRRDTIRDLKRELATITKRAGQIAQAIRLLEGLEGPTEDTDRVTRKANGTAATTRLTNPDAAKLVLEKGPRTIREVLDVLAEQGRPITTTKPYRTLYKIFHDNPAFERAEGNKWRLAK